MKKILLGAWASLALLGGAQAAGAEGVSWQKAKVATNDLASLQRGAKLFVNYCLNCHSAAFMRYNRLTDIGLSEKDIKDYMVFTSAKVGDTMVAAIDPHDAKKWFGANPPDLTVIARSRAGHGGTGADYLYTFLRSFYRDANRPTGWNNVLYPNVGMPNPLWEMQGEHEPIFEKVSAHGQEVSVFKGWKQVSPGTSANFDRDVNDLVNYLTWMAEPAQNTRVRIGVAVMLFLLVLSFMFWRLNKAYWKEVE
ncbi:cytochrome c1 [Comamonas serinivorans]|uniref:Cytochrome c1 n=1 Tax=Comamonas serinivorans TaxID=1082851 RepID=A0A1Y0ETR0_9BURK|nr:cytochrome c1 [Comamonas serinivorans]ARU06918.1 cytochrome c1 [Comamonas serinivorans]